MNIVRGKIYIGYIMNYQDPLNSGRLAVYIPELFPLNYPGKNYVFCRNGISTFHKSRDPFSKEYISYGSYTPIHPGTRVLVTFLNENLENGIIIGIDSDTKLPIQEKDAKNYYLIMQTKNGSRIYFDENKNIFHIMAAQGKTNIYLSETDILLQTEEFNPETGDLKRRNAIDIDDNGINFYIGEAVYSFTEEGLTITYPKSSSYFNITKNGIDISAKKYINLSSDEGKIHVYSKNLFLNGYNETHVLSNDLRLTGSQKAQLSGTTVNVQGWFDTHIKGMHVGIDSIIMTSLQSLVTNKLSLAYENSFSSLSNETSIIKTITTTTYARGSTLNLIDGMTIRGMGLGASVSSSVGTTLSSTSTALQLSLMSINTTLLLNDPSGAMAAANSILTNSIAGTASAASGANAFVFKSANPNGKDPLSGYIAFIKDSEDKDKFNIIPDTIMVMK